MKFDLKMCKSDHRILGTENIMHDDDATWALPSTHLGSSHPVSHSLQLGIFLIVSGLCAFREILLGIDLCLVS